MVVRPGHVEMGNERHHHVPVGLRRDRVNVLGRKPEAQLSWLTGPPDFLKQIESCLSHADHWDSSEGGRRGHDGIPAGLCGAATGATKVAPFPHGCAAVPAR